MQIQGKRYSLRWEFKTAQRLQQEKLKKDYKNFVCHCRCTHMFVLFKFLFIESKIKPFSFWNQMFPDPPAQHYHRLASVGWASVQGDLWGGSECSSEQLRGAIICVRLELINLRSKRSSCMYHWYELFMILIVWSQSSIHLCLGLSDCKDPQQHSSHINTHLNQVGKSPQESTHGNEALSWC